MALKLCQNSINELFCFRKVSQDTVHHTDKELYTEETPYDIYSMLCIHSYSHILRVPCKLLMLLVGSSRLYSIHHQISCSIPIHLATEALELLSSFGPNSDLPGRQLSWYVG